MDINIEIPQYKVIVSVISKTFPDVEKKREYDYIMKFYTSSKPAHEIADPNMPDYEWINDVSKRNKRLKELTNYSIFSDMNLEELYQVRFGISYAICDFPNGYVYNKKYLISYLKDVCPSLYQWDYEHNFHIIASALNIIYSYAMHSLKIVVITNLSTLKEHGIIPVKIATYSFLNKYYFEFCKKPDQYYFVHESLCVDELSIPKKDKIIDKLDTLLRKSD